MTQDTEREVDACPECDSSDIYERSIRRYPKPERWRCNNCGHTFPEPTERPPRQPGGNHSKLAQKLIDADPDDYLGEGGR